MQRLREAGTGSTMIHWSAIGVAVVAGTWAAIREPALPLFEQGTRALGLSGPGLQILAMIYWVAEVTIVLAAAYLAVSLALRAVAGRAF